MTSKPATLESMEEQEAKYRAGIEEFLAEFTTIRREMKKTDAEIRRLESSTRRKLDQIRARLYVEKTV